MSEEKTKKEKTVAEEPKTPPAPAQVNLTDLVDQTTDRISFLKKKQEELQNQKADLEELKRQKKELVRNRREVLAGLDRALAVLESEESDLQRKHALVKATREEFKEISKEVRGIREESWKEEDLKAELSQALATVAKAKRSFTAARGKVEAISSRGLNEKTASPAAAGPAQPLLPSSAGEIFRRGLIFFLPAAILALLIAVIIRLLRYL